MNFSQLSKCSGFQWDEGNKQKNWETHRVSNSECEQIFFNRPLITAQTTGRSTSETRYYALGKTDQERRLFVVFTIRDDLIRVISARDMSRKERRIYQNAQEETNS